MFDNAIAIGFTIWPYHTPISRLHRQRSPSEIRSRHAWAYIGANH